jgi:hypothetical protein
MAALRNHGKSSKPRKYSLPAANSQKPWEETFSTSYPEVAGANYFGFHFVVPQQFSVID